MTKYGGMSDDGRIHRTRRTVDEKIALVLQGEKFDGTRKEAAAYLGVIPTMLRRWTNAYKRGELKVGDSTADKGRTKVLSRRQKRQKHQRYLPEDKVKMLQLARNFPSTAAAAKDLGISEGNLRRWKKETPPSALVTHRMRAPNGRSPSLATSDDDAKLELALLRGIAQLAVRRGLFALDLLGVKGTKED